MDLLKSTSSGLTLCTLAFGLNLTSLLQAQDALDQPEIVQEVDSSELDYYGITTGDDGDRFPIRASLGVSGYYDDNVFISDGGERDDFVWELNPSIGYESSDPEDRKTHFVTAVYDPIWRLFTSIDGISSYNNRGFGQYIYTGEKTSLEIFHRSEEFSEASRDFAGRTEGNRHNTKVGFGYDFTEKMSVLATGNQYLSFYDSNNLNSRHNWFVDAFLLYEVLPKLKVGLGPRLGWEDIQGSPNQMYQQGLFRAIYNPTEKLQIDGSVGAEVRQYQSPLGRDDRVTPALSLEVTWLPFDSTEISLEGYRNNNGSVSFGGQNTESTGFEAGITQRFLQRFFYTLSGGYEYTEYVRSANGVAANREDDYFFVRNELNYQFVEWFNAGVFHEINVNESNRADFVRNRVGFNVIFQY